MIQLILASILLTQTGTVLATRQAQNGRMITPAESQTGKFRPEQYRAIPEKFSEYKLLVTEGEGIVYGESVSRNEFGLKRYVIPSPDSSRLAVFRKDESSVDRFPLLDISSGTGRLKSIRYPMIGTASEKLQLCIFDTFGNEMSRIVPTEYTDERYLASADWTPDGKGILVQVMDREQHNMKLNLYRAFDGSYARTILEEHNDAWVDVTEGVHFIKDGSGRFIYSTDNRDGYDALYVCDTLGRIARLTNVAADVRYVANDGIYVYYTSSEVSPSEQYLYRLRIPSRPGKRVPRVKFTPTCLTPEKGWHEVTPLTDSTFLDVWSSFNDAGASFERSRDGRVVKTLVASQKDPLDGVLCGEVEFGYVPTADGSDVNFYRFIKPANFQKGKKYPLIVYVYGGPHSQMVTNSWMAKVRMWEVVMSQRGYAVYVQDNRGTKNHGAAYEKAINRCCGKVESEDQIAGLKALLQREKWIDAGRIGVNGWSYGGFMSISLYTSYPELFKVCVAGGPVIDWKWYEVMYGERYMDTPLTNPEGFRSSSLMNAVDKVHGHLTIIQGAMDNTVLSLNCASFIQKCIEQGKDVNSFYYPCSEHNMFGKARCHLYEKITDIFLKEL